MVEKAKSGKHDEVVQFNAYKKFCKDTTAEKEYAVKVGNEEIARLKADIQKYTSDAERLAREVKELDAEISTRSGELKAATKVRAQEKEDYSKTYADYTESITALDDGLAELEKQNKPSAQASALLTQLADKSLIPEDQKRIIYAFLDTDPDENMALGEPEGAAYEFQAQGIVD